MLNRLSLFRPARMITRSVAHSARHVELQSVLNEALESWRDILKKQKSAKTLRAVIAAFGEEHVDDPFFIQPTRRSSSVGYEKNIEIERLHCGKKIQAILTEIKSECNETVSSRLLAKK